MFRTVELLVREVVVDAGELIGGLPMAPLRACENCCLSATILVQDSRGIKRFVFYHNLATLLVVVLLDLFASELHLRHLGLFRGVTGPDLFPRLNPSALK